MVGDNPLTQIKGIRLSPPIYTANVEMSHCSYFHVINSRLSHIRENKYKVKISFTMPYTVENNNNLNLNPCKLAYFLKFAKIYTSKIIYVHSRPIIMCRYAHACQPILGKYRARYRENIGDGNKVQGLRDNINFGKFSFR